MPSSRRSLLLAGGTLLASPAIVRSAISQTVSMTPSPAPGFYRFKVGSFTVTTVHDGFFVRPVEGTVLNAPLADVRALLNDAFLPTDRFFIPITITFLDTGRDLVVFDSGNGITPPNVPFGQIGRAHV